MEAEQFELSMRCDREVGLKAGDTGGDVQACAPTEGLQIR